MTAVVGKNMAGKSTVANAIRIGLLGYSPAKGDKPNLTWGYSSSREMVIGLQMGSMCYEHRWASRNGKISHEGPEPLCPPLLLDIQNEYLHLSGPAKMALIFEKLNLDKIGFATENIVERVRKGTNGNGETRAEILDQAISSIRKAAAGRQIQSAITSCLDQFETNRKNAKALSESMAGLIKSQTVLGMEDGGLMRTLSASLFGDAQRAELKEAEVKLRTVEAAAIQQKNQAAERAENTDELESVIGELSQYEDLSKDLEACESRNKMWTQAGWMNPESITEAEKTLAEAQGKMWEANHRKTIYEEAGSELDKNLRHNLTHDNCPLCQSKGSAWKKALTKSVTAQFKELQKKHKTAEADQEAACAEIIKAEGLIKIRKENHAQGIKIEAELKTLREHQQQRAGLLDKKEKLTKWFAANPAADESQIAIDQTLRERIDALKKLEAEHNAELAKIEQAETARQRGNKATEEMEIWKEAAGVMKEIQSELMEKGFGSFMERVNLFTVGILKKPLEFREGTIGYQDEDGPFVGIDHFSGTEQMLAGIGLAVALAQESPVKIVTIDEWKDDAETRMKVIRRLKELIEQQVIDQAIVIDTRPDDYESLGYKLIKV